MKLKCPICGNELEPVDLGFRAMMVRDGNNVHQCVADKTHRFWNHPFSYKTYHWHPEASITNCDWYKCWTLDENNNWTNVEINEENIGSRQR